MSKRYKKKQKDPKREPLFEEGDLVGGKVKGHTMWPGIVESVKLNGDRRKYTVRFFLTNDSSDKCAEIKHFRDFSDKERTCNKKGFQNALSLCKAEYEKRLKENPSVSQKQPQDRLQQEPVCKQEHDQIKDDQKNEELTLEQEQEELAEVKEEAKHEDNQEQNEQKEEHPMHVEEPTHVKEEKNDSEENDETYKVSLDVRTPQSEPLTQINSLKTEGENVILNPTRQQIIAKLEEKVAKKIKEKEALKEELKAAKLFKKIIKNLKIVNKYLERFSIALDKISTPNVMLQHLVQWDSAVRNYELKVFPVLDKCVKYSDKQLCNHDNVTSEYRKSNEIITSIIANLRAGRKNESLPQETKRKFKQCLKVTKLRNAAIDQLLKSTKLDNPKNAMTERSINDVK